MLHDITELKLIGGATQMQKQKRLFSVEKFYWKTQPVNYYCYFTLIRVIRQTNIKKQEHFEK